MKGKFTPDLSPPNPLASEGLVHRRNITMQFRFLSTFLHRSLRIKALRLDGRIMEVNEMKKKKGDFLITYLDVEFSLKK